MNSIKANEVDAPVSTATPEAPAAAPIDSPSKPLKFSVKKKTGKSSVLQLHIKDTLVTSLKKASEKIVATSDFEFSSSILVRRAIYLYSQSVLAMTHAQTQSESFELYNNYR